MSDRSDKQKRTVTLRGFGTHTYTRTDVRSPETYCPKCGKQEVWVEDSEGDYYVGPSYFCDACGAEGVCWHG